MSNAAWGGKSAEEKTRENRLRRWAKRLGFELQKSRAREIHVDDLGGYRLVDQADTVLHGARFNLDMDDVEGYLEDAERQLRGEG